MKLFKSMLTPERIALGLVIILAAFIHGYNMLRYPYFENDEGIYMAQAWSFLTQGQLSPYTYWYDHAPAGWIFSSLWIFLTGGLFTFGFSMNSARIFMWIIHLVSTWLLYKITKKITSSNLASILTCLFFTLSPLAVYFQRRFLLDNIMIFWLLLSLFLILFAKNSLRNYILSAICFGIAVLSKENAIFFLPFLAVLVATESHTHHRKFAVIKWLAIACMIIALYPLFALLKGELFPSGHILSAPGEHVSLMGTLKMQSSRGTGLPFWDTSSDFRTNLEQWFRTDSIFILVGSVALFVQALLAFISKPSRIIFFLNLSILAFLMSGKLVINFYVIALIPFLAMAIGYTAALPAIYIGRLSIYLYIFLAFFLVASTGLVYASNNKLREALTNDETSVQQEAVDWVKEHINDDDFVVIDYYGNLDLNQSRSSGDPRFPDADWYWKVELDEDIRKDKLAENSNNIDYIMLTAQMYKDLQTFPQDNSLLRRALANSSLVVLFSNNNEKFILPDYPKNHPNGDWVAVYKQNTKQDVLTDSWDFFKKTYIAKSGQLGTEKTIEVTGRDYAMTLMRAALMDDEETFKKVLNWTESNLMTKEKKLLISSYRMDGDQMEVVNEGTTTDSDVDLALALLIAYSQWKNVDYLKLAQEIVEDIWQYETVTVRSQRYLVAGDWTSGNEKDEYTMNPSHFAPYAFRLFGQVDEKHNWDQLVDTSYETLQKCSSLNINNGTSIFLPPNWCSISNKGEIKPARDIGMDPQDYSFEAYRIPTRIALDYYWNKDERAMNFLQSMNLWQKEWQKNNKIFATYTSNGFAKGEDESLGQYASMLAYFSQIDKEIAEEIYVRHIIPRSTSVEDGIYWGDKSNIFDQHWVWLSFSIYSNQLPKLQNITL